MDESGVGRAPVHCKSIFTCLKPMLPVQRRKGSVRGERAEGRASPYTSQPSGFGCSPLLSGRREEQPEPGRERGKLGPGMNPQPLSSKGKAWAGKKQRLLAASLT